MGWFDDASHHHGVVAKLYCEAGYDGSMLWGRLWLRFTRCHHQARAEAKMLPLLFFTAMLIALTDHSIELLSLCQDQTLYPARLGCSVPKLELKDDIKSLR